VVTLMGINFLSARRMYTGKFLTGCSCFDGLFQKTIFLTDVGPQDVEAGQTDGIFSRKTRDFFRSTIKRSNAHLHIDSKYAIGDAVQNDLVVRLYLSLGKIHGVPTLFGPEGPAIRLLQERMKMCAYVSVKG
jgi:hypothetical protein